MAQQLFGFGCHLDSDIDIPGALPAHPGHGAAEDRLSITLAPVQPFIHLSSPPTGDASAVAGFTRHDDTIIYRHPHGMFACNAQSITVTPSHEKHRDDLSSLLIANALPASLWQRGAYMLHASSLRTGDQGAAFAIAGPSGSGKSSLAAQWLAMGMELIADDSIALRLTEGLPLASGLPAGYFSGRADTPERHFHALAHGPSRGQAALTALFILQRHDGPVTLTRLSRLDALERLLAHRHRPQVPHLLHRHTTVLDQARKLAECLAVFVWRRPHGEPLLNRAERVMIDQSLKERVAV